MKKRKADAYVRPAGKQMNAARRKKMATTPKAATVAASKIVAASVPKAGAMSKGAAASKAANAGQKGAPGTMKVMMLKVKSRVKRPVDMELSLMKAIKETKMFFLA
jgi:hypothetical protein